jgi:hypothetical protein
MIELRHAAIAIDDRLQHAEHGIDTETVALGDIGHHLLAAARKLSHDHFLSVKLHDLHPIGAWFDEAALMLIRMQLFYRQ